MRNYSDIPLQSLSNKAIEKIDAQFGTLSDNDVEEPRAHLKELIKLGIDIRKEPQLLEEIKIEAGPLDESCSEKFIESVNHMNEPIKEVNEAEDDEPLDVGSRVLARSQEQTLPNQATEPERKDEMANKDAKKEGQGDYRIKDLFELLVKTNQVKL